MPLTQEQIDSFHRFASEQLRNGPAEVTIDELYDLWRARNPAPEELHADVLAVKASLRDMENGDPGQVFDEFQRNFRARNNIPDDA